MLYIQRLCAREFGWLEAIKEAVCSPLTSVLLFAAGLWCLEKLWLGYPSQTNTQEIPVLCALLNNPLTIHGKAFIPFKTTVFNFLLIVCLSPVMGYLVCLFFIYFFGGPTLICTLDQPELLQFSELNPLTCYDNIWKSKMSLLIMLSGRC